MGDDVRAAEPGGGMPGHEAGVSIAENYRRFGEQVRERCPEYARLATAVTSDEETLALLSTLPPGKRQPNLLFAAARYLLGAPADPGTLHELVRERSRELAGVMRARRTQTNEPARCATMLPALAELEGPLALLEVGASAGLTLLPDRYSYDYAGHHISGSDPDAPVLSCRPHGSVPLPARPPTIVWRAGIDLDPLDVTDAADVRWLECLLWPGESGRHARLHAALDTARREPAPVHRGDLVDDLPRTAAEAPREATLVIQHSAVLAYVTEQRRREFASVVAELGAVWLSNESPGVVTTAEQPHRAPEPNSFVLVLNGRQHLATTDAHGSWVRWHR